MSTNTGMERENVTHFLNWKFCSATKKMKSFNLLDLEIMLSKMTQIQKHTHTKKTHAVSHMWILNGNTFMCMHTHKCTHTHIDAHMHTYTCVHTTLIYK